VLKDPKYQAETLYELLGLSRTLQRPKNIKRCRVSCGIGARSPRLGKATEAVKKPKNARERAEIEPSDMEAFEFVFDPAGARNCCYRDGRDECW
jgi:hypothetical protein